MKTPQIAAMPGMTPLGLNPRSVDERTVAERKWQSGSWIKVKVPQKPCDVGLFSDDSKQEELF
jgi:hypothetical protein